MAIKRTFNQIITTGILARLHYEYTRHEGLILNLVEETEPSGMEAFNILEGYKQIMQTSFEAIEELVEKELQTEEDVKTFCEKYDVPSNGGIVKEAVKYVLETGTINNEINKKPAPHVGRPAPTFQTKERIF